MALNSYPIYVTNIAPVEVKAPRGGRSFLEIQNDDAAEIFFEENIIPTSETGLPIAGGATRSWGAGGTSYTAVPQGNIWIIGSTAGLQKAIVRQA